MNAVTAVTAVQQTNNTIDPYELEFVDAHALFPGVFAPNESKVKRRKFRHPDCIASNPNYVPQEITLRRALAWWHGRQLQPLGLHGETGTGKTELLLFIADMLNEPVYMIKTHMSLMPEDLEGSKELVSTDNGVITRNKLGLVAKGYAYGGLVILDEIDKGNDSFHCSIHGLVEGKPWPIEQFGITIQKHGFCRISATANTMGEGGHERYHTSNRMDAALRSRFGWLQCGYPDMGTELEIIEKGFPKLPRKMVQDCIRFGNSIRDAVLGQDRSGKIDSPLGAVFSTRTLVNWCDATMSFGLSAKWKESLDFSFAGSIDPESLNSVNDIKQRIFGNKLEMSLKDVITEYSPVKK